MKLVFFGSSRYVIPILDLLKREHELLMVVTTEQGSQEPVKFFCSTNKINSVSVRKTGDLMANSDLHQVKADLGIVADFGIIIPEDILNLFPKGIINVHPSLLPKYRGPTPVQTAILNGDTKTGVSIIKLDKLMDHGPILAQKEETINPSDSSKTLYERLFKIGKAVLSDVLLKYEHNNITPRTQDDLSATYTKILTREDGYFDLKSLEIESSKQEVYRKIKAYFPWPGTWTRVMINDKLLIIKFLPENLVQVEGKRPMDYKDFINGYPKADKNFLNFLQKDLE